MMLDLRMAVCGWMLDRPWLIRWWPFAHLALRLAAGNMLTLIIDALRHGTVRELEKLRAALAASTNPYVVAMGEAVEEALQGDTERYVLERDSESWRQDECG